MIHKETENLVRFIHISMVAHECHSKNFNKLKLKFVFIIKLKFFS